jgi:prepilin-type N-terminal cleavage/methylation domain-containing protein
MKRMIAMMNTKKNAGFTLIELLIVIGLLGALTAIILPSLSADREEAVGVLCDYSQSGTIRVLKQFHQLTGLYPNDLHTGLQTGAVAGGGANPLEEDIMPGIPEAQGVNLSQGNSFIALTQDQVDSLTESGITSVCYGEGLNSQPLVAGSVVVELLDSWLDDTPAAYSFDGQTLAEWRSKIDGGGTIIVLWVAPTTDWSNKANPNKDWSGGNVEIGMDIEGQCPVPGEDVNGNDPEFAYYMAYFLVDNDSSNGVTPAELIGTSCPECGVMNP